MVYYNENDPQTAEWLQAVIDADLIAPGVVDTRSIEDVEPDDLDGFSQCHFFAGIGGWAYALRLAGWPDDQHVWTGSCPCQPFCAAGKKAGFADERHLWPAFFWLIQQHKPSTLFGEQVAGPLGRVWLDLVSTDLEGEGYAIGAADLTAASIEAPHIRQRLFWVADTHSEGRTRSVQIDRSQSSRSAVKEWRAITKALGDHTFGTAVAGYSWLCKPILYTGDDGLSARVGRLRGYGNAIVPALAAEVIKAYVEALKH